MENVTCHLGSSLAWPAVSSCLRLLGMSGASGAPVPEVDAAEELEIALAVQRLYRALSTEGAAAEDAAVEGIAPAVEVASAGAPVAAEPRTREGYEAHALHGPPALAHAPSGPPAYPPLGLPELAELAQRPGPIGDWARGVFRRDAEASSQADA